MQAWANYLGVTADTVLYLIFQEEAGKRPGNQWARKG